MEVHTAQGEDLASQGYIVVAIDHPYVAGATQFPDRIVTAREATTNFTGADPVVTITRIMAQDVQFVLDELARLEAGAVPSEFKGELDLGRIGIIGQSLGGAVAYDLALHDRRIKAAIDLDGSVYVAPSSQGDRMAPFLMIVNDRFHLQAIQARDIFMTPYGRMTSDERQVALVNFGTRAAYEQAYRNANRNMAGLVRTLKHLGSLYTIRGSDHMKFTDIGLFVGLQQVREGRASGARQTRRGVSW